MNRSSAVVAITLLLCACKPVATEVEPVKDAQTAPAAATTATAAVVPEELQPTAQSPAGDAPATADAAPDADADAPAVDAAIDANLGDHAVYRQVFDAFKQAVAAHDAATVAALVHYPIGVDINGKKTVIKDRPSFVSQYDQFMTPAITKAITDATYGSLFVNYKGVMLGQGEAWINGICKDNACNDVDVKVVTIQPGP